MLFCFRSQSKASYLAYRRERGAPDSEGSYKRTMSPTSRMDDWSPPRDHDDPVLLRVTPHHHHHNNHHQQQHSELSKSYSVDALHHRLEDRCSQQQQLSTEMVSKLSHDLNKKLQSSDVTRTNENNNNDNLEDRHHHHYQEKRYPEKRHEQRRERLSPQSVEVLNDRNRQLERERRKLAASCEPLPQNREVRLSLDVYLHVIATFACFSHLNSLSIFALVYIAVSRTREFNLHF